MRFKRQYYIYISFSLFTLLSLISLYFQIQSTSHDQSFLDFVNLAIFWLTINGIAYYHFKWRNRVHDEEISRSKVLVDRASQFSVLGEVAAAVTHEINNPLTIIQGLSDRLLMQVKKGKLEGEEVVRVADKLIANTKRISKIIQSMKTLSRNADQDPVEPTELGQVLDEALTLVDYKLRNKMIVLKTENFKRDLLIECRPVQFVQIFVNLMNNSIDAVEKFESKWIELITEKVNDRVRIVFRDCGLGIPKDVALRMMEPLYTTKPAGRGTGLGLSITKDIVQSLGGQFFLDDNQKHTTFVIELKDIGELDLTNVA